MAGVRGLRVSWSGCGSAGTRCARRENKPEPATQRRPAPEPAAAVVPVTEEEDPELAAYNRYLARLNETAE